MSAFQLLLFIRKEVLNRTDSLEIYFKSALITRTMRFAPLLEVYSYLKSNTLLESGNIKRTSMVLSIFIALMGLASVNS